MMRTNRALVFGAAASLGAAIFCGCALDWDVTPGSSGGAGSRDVTCSSAESCTCAAGDSCSMTCDQQGCDIVCEENATCDVQCTTASCDIECKAGSTCNVTCTGASCDIACSSAKSCEKDCPLGSSCTCAGC